ncbi:MAG: HAD family phosphatase [Terriglobia bacterium]
MIEVVYLDLGKVLIDFDYASAAQRIVGISPIPLAEIQLILSEPKSLYAFETGKISPVDYYLQVCRELEIKISMEQFRALWGSMFLPDPLVSESFLLDLKRNYRLILLSNTNEIHFEYLEENYPLLRQIEEHLLSYQVGFMKPDPKIYELAIEKAGVAPDKIFFADDRHENVEAARLAGIQAIQFSSENQLRKEMKKYGILC